jgi:hypothetical protein
MRRRNPKSLNRVGNNKIIHKNITKQKDNAQIEWSSTHDAGFSPDGERNGNSVVAAGGLSSIQ